MKRNLLVIAAVLVLVTCAGGVLFLTNRPSIRTAVPAATQPDATQDVSLPATLQAINLVEVGVPITGKIEAFHVEVGDEVYEGQLLAQIRSQALESQRESAELQLRTAQERLNTLESAITAARLEESRAAADASRARSELERAEKYFERQRLLLAEGATPRNEHDRAEKDYVQAQAQLKILAAVAEQSAGRLESLQKEHDNARKLLDARSEDWEAATVRTGAGEIVSPVAGVLASRRGEPGENVDPSVKDFFRIATDLSVMEAVAEPDPAALGLFKPQQPALVTLAELSDPLTGTVKSVKDGKVIVEFGNPNPAIRPGLVAQITVRIR